MNLRHLDRYMDRMMPMVALSIVTGAQSEKQKRKEGRTCPMPKQLNRFPRK